MSISLILLIVLVVLVILILVILLIPIVINLINKLTSSKNIKNMGTSSKIRLFNQLRETVENLSETKTGAIITIEMKDNIDNLRTDGIQLDANISASLLLTLFDKHSPLHDGAVVIRNNKIVYAGTYYKITKKSINNKYGARHRAAMGISEMCDAVTIVVSEETGSVTIAKNGAFTQIPVNQFQEKLIFFLKD